MTVLHTMLRLEPLAGNPVQRPFYFMDGAQSEIKGIIEGREYPLNPARHPQVRTIVDIGANVGAASLFFWSNFPNAQVHAFEPLPSANTLLKKNLNGLPRTHAHPYGLSDHVEDVTIHHSLRHGLGASSVVKSADHGDASSHVVLHEINRTLDKLEIGHIDILKIDTEGYEPRLLQAIEHRLDDVDYLLLEAHSDAARVWIENLLLSRFMMTHSSLTCVHRSVLMYANRKAVQARRVIPLMAPPVTMLPDPR